MPGAIVRPGPTGTLVPSGAPVQAGAVDLAAFGNTARRGGARGGMLDLK